MVGIETLQSLFFPDWVLLYLIILVLLAFRLSAQHRQFSLALACRCDLANDRLG
jgi:hypothetical protein